MPEGLLSEPAKDALREKKLSDLMGGELSTLLEDIKIGYFLDVTYEKQSDGSYEIVYADPAHPTTAELIAPLSMGKLLDAAANGGDVLAVVKSDIGECKLSSLLDGLEEPMASLLDGKTLGDVIAVDSVGAGIGETVLLTVGSSARLALANQNAPVDAVIVGIVD